jgi:hypothetical protein
VILIAIGLGLGVLMTFAGGVPEQALGVGGFIVILGLGFFVNSLPLRAQPDAASPPISPARTSRVPLRWI